MVTVVRLQKFGETMQEATVREWYKREGAKLEKGEPLLAVETAKFLVDVEAPTSGILVKIVASEGSEVEVGGCLGIIAKPSEDLSDIDKLIGDLCAKPHAGKSERVAAIKEAVRISPRARRLAQEHGIDIAILAGTVPEGRIVEADVRHFIEQTSGILPKVKEIIPLKGFRKTSAERVSASFRKAPHSTVVMEVDASRAMELHNKLQASYTAVLMKVVSKTLVEYSIINSTLEGSQIKIFEDVNVGVAVATENGLVVPVIHNADKKSLGEIDAAIEELTEKARQGKLAREDLAGGTFTITNLGMYGVDLFTPIINPPEAAILGVGRIVEKPVVVEGKIETKPITMLSLSYDHRIVDGAPAAEFLRKVKKKIENLEY